MKKLFEVTLSGWTTVGVEAETEEQAIEIARDEVYAGDLDIDEVTTVPFDESQRENLIRHYGEILKDEAEQ